MRIGNELLVCLRGLSAVPVDHVHIPTHVDMHFHSFLLFYACIPFLPKQNQQQHARINFKLAWAWLHEDGFWSSKATGNLERNSLGDTWDWWWRVWICHIVDAVTARACVGQTPCPFKWCECEFGEGARWWSRRVQGASWKQCQPQAQRCPMGIRLGTVLFCGSWDWEWQNGLLSAAATSC